MKHTLLVLLSAWALSAEMKSDVEFAKPGGFSLTLDASIPDGPGPFPAIVIVHGGGWRAGDKQTFVGPLFEPLEKAGIAWFSVNYRLAPAYTYPAAVDDVIEGIRFVQAHAKEYKVDLKRLALTGESAGGHLAGLIGARDGKKLKLAAVVPFYGGFDLEALIAGDDPRPRESVRGFFGFEKLDDAVRRRLREGSAMSYVKRDMPPFLLIHGTADPAVPITQSTKMCEAMKAAGAICEVYLVEGGVHGIINWVGDPAKEKYKAKMVEWLKQVMK